MRHRKSGRRLGRTSAHRKAMYRNMVTSLMVHGQIKTTQAKAKELRRIADKIITMGTRVPPSSLEGLKGEDLKAAQARRVHFIRRVRRWVNDPAAIERLFGEYAERYKQRPGGYTRILKAGFRSGDDAPMALIELVGDFDPASAKVKAVKPEAAPEEPVVEAASEAAEEVAAEEPAAEEVAEEEVAEEEVAAEEPAAEEPAEEEVAAEEPAAEE
jgi:large subunit ribosomal protein L17